MNPSTHVSHGQHWLYMIMILLLLSILSYVLIERQDVNAMRKANTQLRCIGGLVHNPIGQLLRDETGKTLSCDKYSNVTQLKYE